MVVEMAKALLLENNWNWKLEDSLDVLYSNFLPTCGWVQGFCRNQNTVLRLFQQLHLRGQQDYLLTRWSARAKRLLLDLSSQGPERKHGRNFGMVENRSSEKMIPDDISLKLDTRKDPPSWAYNRREQDQSSFRPSSPQLMSRPVRFFQYESFW